MQMEINDIRTIQPPIPPAFVLANGNSSQATNTSVAHLQKESMVTIPGLRINRDLWATNTNTVNIVKKLVTIFAGHLDSFIVTNNHFNHLKTTVTSGSGQISVQMTLIPFVGIGKNCAILVSLPGLFPCSQPGLPTG